MLQIATVAHCNNSPGGFAHGSGFSTHTFGRGHRCPGARDLEVRHRPYGGGIRRHPPHDQHGARSLRPCLRLGGGGGEARGAASRGSDRDRQPVLRAVTGSTCRLHGELTIRRITHPVDAHATFGGSSVDPWGNEKIGFSVTAEIDRELWDLCWNLPLDMGGWVVSRRVWLTVNVEAVRT